MWSCHISIVILSAAMTDSTVCGFKIASIDTVATVITNPSRPESPKKYRNAMQPCNDELERGSNRISLSVSFPQFVSVRRWQIGTFRLSSPLLWILTQFNGSGFSCPPNSNFLRKCLLKESGLGDINFLLVFGNISVWVGRFFKDVLLEGCENLCQKLPYDTGKLCGTIGP